MFATTFGAFVGVVFALKTQVAAYEYTFNGADCNNFNFTLSILSAEYEQADSVELQFYDNLEQNSGYVPITQIFSQSDLRSQLSVEFEPSLSAGTYTSQLTISILANGQTIIYPDGTGPDTETENFSFVCQVSEAQSAASPTTATATTTASSSPIAMHTSTASFVSPISTPLSKTSTFKSSMVSYTTSTLTTSPSQPPSVRDDRKTPIVAGGAVGGIAAVAFLLLLLICLRRQRRKRRNIDTEDGTIGVYTHPHPSDFFGKDAHGSGEEEKVLEKDRTTPTRENDTSVIATLPMKSRVSANSHLISRQSGQAIAPLSSLQANILSSTASTNVGEGTQPELIREEFQPENIRQGDSPTTSESPARYNKAATSDKEDVRSMSNPLFSDPRARAQK